MNTIQEIENEQVVKLMADKSLPEFAPGDTLKVNVKVVEGPGNVSRPSKACVSLVKMMALTILSPSENSRAAGG